METEKKSNGAFVGLIIIIIILVIGGIYIWMSKKEIVQPQQLNSDQLQTTDEQNANALDALEQDVEKVDTSVGVDVNNIN